MVTVDRQDLKKRVADVIDDKAEYLQSLGEKLFACPELGYKEHRTAEIVAGELSRAGLSPRTGIAITGVVADYAAGPGPVVALMGELDAVVCPGHPQADPVTGAAHSCGHNAMTTSVIGAALGLIGAGAMEHLSGGIRFMAVPAEEYVEIGFRRQLRQQGKIEFMGGKQEFLKLGEFDDVDASMIIHLGSGEGKKIRLGGSSNGFLGKFVRFRGREAHAGGAPHAGVNALNAAMLGMMGIHAQRETFRDEDCIRVHPIITSGGDLVNIVPADVTMETYVRGRTLEAITDASTRVDRALKAGAMAVGGEVEIEDLPGYLPRHPFLPLEDLFAANAALVLGEDAVEQHSEHQGGSTDFGDLSHIMPGVHPSVMAVSGRGHSEDYRIVDPRLAYVETSKIMALTAVDLLWDGAGELLRLKSAFTPRHTVESYLKAWRDLLSS